MKNKLRLILLVLTILTDRTFCQDNGGFEKVTSVQETAPGMILIEGGVYDFPEATGTKTDSLYSFYISAYEETNGQYLAYLKFIRACYSETTYRQALPDTTVWEKENIADSLKSFLVKNYLRGEAFKDFPVVGLSPEQIIKYASWKTDRMNEMILIREGLLDFDYYPKDSLMIFSTEVYLSGKWKGELKQKLPSFEENNPERDVRIADGIFLPPFRIATEKEWKLAALAIGDKNHNYIKTPKECKIRKFDKQNYFGHLYVKRQKAKNKNAIKLSNEINLNEVYNTSCNNYRVHSLNENVSEWIIDSTGRFVVAGGSWKNPGPVYSAIYNKVKKNYAYHFVLPFFSEGGASAATGFRLTMSYIGKLDPGIKRRKVK